jgi:hypothetical protein
MIKVSGVGRKSVRSIRKKHAGQAGGKEKVEV